MKKTLHNHKGFTLIEILLVVAAIAILAGIVIIAINPGKQLADVRNAQRRSDVSTILNAVYQYTIDIGEFPDALTSDPLEICKTDENCTGLVDLSVLIEDQKYLTSFPIDPSSGLEYSTGYTVFININNRITVAAPFAERDEVISVSR